MDETPILLLITASGFAHYTKKKKLQVLHLRHSFFHMLFAKCMQHQLCCRCVLFVPFFVPRDD
uniref:Uncharacterized protein n=1 Tax=Arundo donax TaxID=35708 RepID=A0A0A9EB09_ARUDO